MIRMMFNMVQTLGHALEVTCSTCLASGIAHAPNIPFQFVTLPINSAALASSRYAAERPRDLGTVALV